MPAGSTVGRAKQRRVFHSRINGVGFGERRLQMPHSLKLPRMLRAVVPLMRGERLAGFRRTVVDELVALPLGKAFRRFLRLAARRLPGLAAIVGALDDLPKPAAGLRGIQPVRIGRRSLHVIDLPAGKMRAADFPLVALSIRRQYERPFFCANQYSYLAHPHSFLNFYIDGSAMLIPPFTRRSNFAAGSAGAAAHRAGTVLPRPTLRYRPAPSRSLGADC